MSRYRPTRLADLYTDSDLAPVTACACNRHPPIVTSINIPPRGPPPSAQKLGYLTNTLNHAVLVLYGAPLYDGSSAYSYYVDVDGTEIPLNGPSNRPLYTNDTIYVPGRTGVWSVNLYAPRTSFYTYQIN